MSKQGRDEQNFPAIVPQRIESRIFLIRGQKVMLSHDLAELYGVPTRRLNEAVKRNRDRFPADFMFQLSGVEMSQVVANCDHLKNLKYSPRTPYAFTEQGVAMLSSVLHSPTAVRVSIEIMRVFVRLRRMLTSYEPLRRKLADFERRLLQHDHQITMVFDALRTLMDEDESDGPEKPRIGYHTESQPHD